MNALAVWRNATLQQRVLRPPSRPTSPVSDGDINEILPTIPSLPSDEQQQSEERHHHRSKSEPPEEAQGTPTSSWVRWWSRSKKTATPNQAQPDSTSLVKQERSGMRESSTVPIENVRNSAQLTSLDELNFLLEGDYSSSGCQKTYQGDSCCRVSSCISLYTCSTTFQYSGSYLDLTTNIAEIC